MVQVNKPVTWSISVGPFLNVYFKNISLFYYYYYYTEFTLNALCNNKL